MSYNWGPRFIMPSEVIKKYSGHVLLRETLDWEVLNEELKHLGIAGPIDYVTNPWYYRKKNDSTWIKIGESRDMGANFPVSWDTSQLQNGDYEVLGLMHVFVKKDNQEHIIARQNIVNVAVEN